MRTPGRVRQANYRARKYAAGYRIVQGRLTREPRVNRRPGELPPHGTESRYKHHGCRCDECRTARNDADVRRSVSHR